MKTKVIHTVKHRRKFFERYSMKALPKKIKEAFEQAWFRHAESCDWWQMAPKDVGALAD